MLQVAASRGAFRAACAYTHDDHHIGLHALALEQLGVRMWELFERPLHLRAAKKLGKKNSSTAVALDTQRESAKRMVRFPGPRVVQP